MKTAKRSPSVGTHTHTDSPTHLHSLLSPAGPGGDVILSLMNMGKTLINELHIKRTPAISTSYRDGQTHTHYGFSHFYSSREVNGSIQ